MPYQGTGYQQHNQSPRYIGCASNRFRKQSKDRERPVDDNTQMCILSYFEDMTNPILCTGPIVALFTPCGDQRGRERCDESQFEELHFMYLEVRNAVEGGSSHVILWGG